MVRLIRHLCVFLLAGSISLSFAGGDDLDIATFSGGCFWCMVPPFEKLEGVRSILSGYAGGEGENPTYEEVSSGRTGHIESVQITFDPTLVSYQKLLDVFWMNVDPTDTGGQFVDRGEHYRTAIFYHSEEQKTAAEKSKLDLAASKRFKNPIVTEILPFTGFYPAEDYHQDYHNKNPFRYKLYRSNSGRDQFIKENWEKKKENKGP